MRWTPIFTKNFSSISNNSSAENVDRGLTLEDAHREAHRALGNVAVLEEYCRDERRVTWAHDLRQDVAYALRMLRKQPGLTIVAITSLALGIGANTAVLGAFDALFVRGLPVAQADRLVAIQSVRLDNPAQLSGLSLQDYAAIRDRSRSFELVDASFGFPAIWPRTHLGRHRNGSSVSRSRRGGCRFWASRRSSARCLSKPIGLRPRSAPAIVISHDLWLRRFGGDHRRGQSPGAASGQPQNHHRRHARRVPVPAIRRRLLGTTRGRTTTRSGGRLFGVRARLKPGVSLAQAQAELRILAATWTENGPDKTRAGACMSVAERTTLRLDETAAADVRGRGRLGLADCVRECCPRCCSRAPRCVSTKWRSGRRSVPGRGRLIRQVLVESLLLAIGGGVAGLFIALAGQQALVAMTALRARHP
jgi:hypothetical protein